MRKRARVDENQRDIIAAIRKLGATAEPIHQLGDGRPDVLFGYRGRSGTLEVKAPGGKLTEREKEWADEWRGEHHIVYTVNEAIHAVVNGGKNVR